MAYALQLSNSIIISEFNDEGIEFFTSEDGSIMVSNKAYVTINIGSSVEAKMLQKLCEELRMKLNNRPQEMSSLKTDNGIKIFGLAEKSFEERTTGKVINLTDI